MRPRPAHLRIAIVAAVLLAACGSTDNPIATSSRPAGSASAGDETPDAPDAPDATTDDGTTADDGTDGTTDTTDTSADPTAPVSEADGGDPFGWQPYGIDRVQAGTLEVPIDYDDPSAGSFVLYVTRHLADPAKRIGAMLVNPGGPGFGGTDFAIYADQVYSQDLVDHFDIVAWDPRGTGETTPPIDCVDDYDRYFASVDITPDDDAERQQIIDLAKEFEDLCATKNAAILQHIGTNDSARDIDAIRRALGEAQLTYFGFSYGSELGATWATLFPDTVRAAVLDGAVDPNADFLTGGLDQAKGFEDSITRFLAQCSADSSCVFHSDGDAEGAFDALMLALDDDPVPSITGRPDVNRGVALSAVVEAMYSESSWPTLAQGLADARGGDGSLLLQLYDAYFQRRDDGTYDNSLEAFQTISCMDDDTRLTVEEEDASAADYTAVAPRYAPNTQGSYMCTFYPPAEDPRVTITGAGAGPILVVGTTHDPATPLESTEKMAAALEQGVLLVVEANQHTGYGVNQCSYDVVDGYLIDLTVPEDGVRCG